MPRTELTDHELHGVLLNALTVAAERYGEHAADIANQTIAERFAHQQREAIALRDRLEEADCVLIVESPAAARLQPGSEAWERNAAEVAANCGHDPNA